MPSDLEIDFSKISFPSDKLTLGMLRKAYPQDMDSSIDVKIEEDGPGSVGVHIRDMLFVERLFAKDAFNRTVGKKMSGFTDIKGDERDGQLESLTEIYVRCGLASGRHQTEQIARDIEAQGEAQAKERGGRQV